jgi:hypothetical protein
MIVFEFDAETWEGCKIGWLEQAGFTFLFHSFGVDLVWMDEATVTWEGAVR